MFEISTDVTKNVEVGTILVSEVLLLLCCCQTEEKLVLGCILDRQSHKNEPIVCLIYLKTVCLNADLIFVKGYYD